MFRNFVASRGRPRQKRNGGPANPGRRVHVNEVNAGGTLKETNFTTKETKKRGRPVGSKNKPKQPGIENQKSKKPGPGQSRSSANISKTVNDFIELLDRSRSSINSEVPSRISRPVTSDNRLNRCKKSTRMFSTELDAIAESIESPELTPHTSISSSRVTRSMSTKQRLTTTSPSSHHEHDIGEDAESYEICPTCHFELDGTENEVLCPKCQNKIHLDCFRGDGCQCNS